MKTPVLLLLLVTITSPAFSENSQTDGRAQILANLNRVESMYLARLSGKELQDAVRLLNETRALVAGLPESPRDRWNGSDDRLSEEGLQGLLEAIRKEHWDEDRNNIILSSLGQKGRITVAQLKTLVELYSNDHYKKDLLIAIRNNVVDPINIAVVLDFTFPSDRNEVLKAYKNQ